MDISLLETFGIKDKSRVAEPLEVPWALQQYFNMALILTDSELLLIINTEPSKYFIRTQLVSLIGWQILQA